MPPSRTIRRSLSTGDSRERTWCSSRTVALTFASRNRAASPNLTSCGVGMVPLRGPARREHLADPFRYDGPVRWEPGRWTKQDQRHSVCHEELGCSHAECLTATLNLLLETSQEREHGESLRGDL